MSLSVVSLSVSSVSSPAICTACIQPSHLAWDFCNARHHRTFQRSRRHRPFAPLVLFDSLKCFPLNSPQSPFKGELSHCAARLMIQTLVKLRGADWGTLISCPPLPEGGASSLRTVDPQHTSAWERLEAQRERREKGWGGAVRGWVGVWSEVLEACQSWWKTTAELIYFHARPNPPAQRWHHLITKSSSPPSPLSPPSSPPLPPLH